MAFRNTLLRQMDKKNRLHYLDSLRGLAAFSVLLYHFFGWKWDKTIYFKASAFIFNGSDAVSFFFVLSGFVLSYGFFKSDSDIELKSFFIKRIFRLYPAYIVTILLNYLYWNRHGLNFDLIKDMFYINGQQLWQELILLRGNHKFYIPGWTLEAEMALSLLIPIFVIAARNNIKYILYLIPIALFIGGSISMFVFHFLLGTLLAFYYPAIINYDFKKHKLYANRWFLFVLVFCLYSIRHIDKVFPFSPSLINLLKFLSIDFFHITGIASFFIILYSINNKGVQKFLTFRPFLFLGEISYSLYLMHWLVIVYIMEHWDMLSSYFSNSNIAFIALLVLAITVTLLLSTLMYYLVEKPFIMIGKKLSYKK